MITVQKGDPHDAQATALLRESHALMQALFAPEDNHYLSIDALCAPDIHFFVARDGEQALGTGALAEKTGYGEVKSMFVAEAARGKGVADALLRRIEDQARALGLLWLRLETGTLLQAAHRLYARHGFVPRGRFGDYPDNPSSVFMEKSLG
jgi:putative acetyltransferase